MDKLKHRNVTIARHRRLWRFQVRIDGRVVTRSFPTLSDARQALDAVLDRRSTAPTARLLVDRLCTEWLIRQRRLAPATFKNYEIQIRVHIVPKLGALDASLLRPAELEDFYRSLPFATAQKCHNVLRGAYRVAVRDERLARHADPTSIVRPTRRLCADHDGSFADDVDVRAVLEKAIPTRDEVGLLIKDAADRGRTWWWLYLVIAIVTGARPGEICALRRRDIDVERCTVRIEHSADKASKRVKSPKSRWSVRTLRLAREFVRTIEPHLPTEPDAFLFPADPVRGSGLPCMNSKSIERKLERQLRRLSLPRYTPHGFRHYVATHMLDQGESPMQVARFLGHRDDRMVRKLYGAHIVQDSQRAIGEAASRLFLDLELDAGRSPETGLPTTRRR